MSDSSLWHPSGDYLEQANVTRLARAHGIGSYADLRRRSVEDVDWFWDAVVRDLDIRFHQPYEAVSDCSAGLQWCRWFVEGRINVADACVGRHSGSGADAVIWEGEDGATRRVPYSELAAQVSRFAAALRHLGVAKGDAVGLFMPMVPEAVAAFMAIAKVGGLVVPVFSGFAAPAIAARLQDAGAKVLVCCDGFLRRGSVVPMKQTADEAVAACPTVRHVVVVARAGTDVAMAPRRDVFWHDLVSGFPDQADSEDTDAEDPFMIAYTSGTTGKPKGSVHVHGGFLVKIASEVAYQTDYHPGETLFWVTDMGWIMGPWEVVGTLAHGGTVFLYEGAPDYPGPDRLWEMVARHRVNILGISPTLVRALMRHGDELPARHDLSSLRVLGSTGEPWNDAPYRWFFERVGGSRLPIINFSGGTEVGACFLSATVVEPLKSCSLGGPSLGMAVDVFGPDGRPVRGQVGELVCTKPWPGMTRGIWGDSDRYLAAYWSRWPDVWVHGDWAVADDDGQWFLHGRSDDTVNVAGKRIGPAEVESVLVGHPGVSEAAVVGIPDEIKGEALWCFIVPASEAAAGDDLRAELRAHVGTELGKAFTPAAVKFVSELPKTRNAKVLRRAVRAVAMGADPGDLTSLENPSALEEIARAR
ncbi:MAG TPA: AMP-binding protein [Actinomycetota bacterium]|nr:AMP-binding protein [Actinomycetota bacterium]